MVPTRRGRNSLPNSPTPNSNDDFSNLTLAEVRDRLIRNSRVLSSTLFTPSTSPSTSSVLNQHMSSNNNNGAGPSNRPYDPVRAKLEAVREGLLARESELLAMDMEGMNMGGVDVKQEPNSDMEMIDVKVESGVKPVNDPTTPTAGVRRGSAPGTGNGISGGGGRSGKQRALDIIRQGEASLGAGAILLPIEQTLSLGNRDYTTQSLDQFTHLSLVKKTKVKTYDPLDENARAQALARMNNFMSYKGDGDGEGDDEDDGDVFGFDEGEYEGEDDRMGTSGTRARGTGERVDEYGEDEEVWREGAEDEYTLRGGDLDER